MKKRFDYLDLVLIGVIIFSLTFLGVYFYFDKPTQEVILNEVVKIDNITICENKSLVDTSECLKDYLKTFYNYNLSEKDSEYNLTRIKEVGGVCWHYAKWYKDNLINLGFNTKTIEFFGNDTGHEIAIGWTNDLRGGEYCVLDQLDINCVKLGNITKNETN